MTAATSSNRSRSRRRRLLFLAALGVVAIGGAAFYVQFYLARPIGSGPAGPPVERAPFQEPWTQRRVMLLGVGDSVTAGLGATRPDHSYFARLAKNPDDEFPELEGLCLSAVLPKLDTKNVAVSGSTSQAH